MDGVLERSEIFAQGVHEEDTKDVVITEGAHGDDALPERA
jgi:hypothetical protein